MQIGDMRIDALLDGEAVVPPSFCYANYSEEGWEPHKHFLDPFSDMVVHTLGGFLVRYDDKVVLVDAGVGPQPIFPFAGGAMRSAFFKLGVTPSEVTDVVFTHLHLDHIGWATVGGKIYFDNANFHVDKRDWDFFMSPDYDVPEWEQGVSDPSRDPATVRLAPLADRINFFVGDSELLPGIETVDAAGHTPGSTVLRLTSQGEQGMLLGDLVHTQPELIEDRWDFLAHIEHEQGMDSIERIRKELFDKNLPFAAAHFPGLQWGKIANDDSGKLSYARIE
ncbi:MBL fold metallo-hydrolase [soil metagenome]